MTKVTVLGSIEEIPEPRRIEFNYFLPTNSLKFELSRGSGVYPHDYNFIELIAKAVCNGQDLMLAYNNNRNEGCVYLGNFNDGIV